MKSACGGVSATEIAVLQGMMCFMDTDRLPPAFRAPTAPPGTPIGQLSATGTGEVRDSDGNLLDHTGNVVAQHTREGNN